MPNKYALIEHSSAINTIIRNTFQTTHRIKFTAFDVSLKYIVFGVNSGGLYIFTREPCQFLKLIPSTHGPTTLLQISSNEENLAIAVSRGLVIVLVGCFTSNFEQQVFTEHEGNVITALKWNGHDLYCGDSIGRVSVITLKGFLTMFQTPVASLMQLDSQIVQLDTHHKYLLVSTQTRSVLCDTESERYRQIGKKMRDGNFGACFLNCGPPQPDVATSRLWGPFKTLTDNEQLSHFVNDDVKIYCARPGVRLWQADFQANVILTHQFRPSLPEKPSDIIQWNCDEDKLNIKRSETGSSWENFNFTKIYAFLHKFIVTFGCNEFYIFEPSTSALIHWSDLITNINGIKVVDSFLYVWHKDLEVSVFALMSVEELLLRSLIRKKFNLCGELCMEFFDELESLLSTSKKIHLLSALEEKLNKGEVLEKLAPIFQQLKESAKGPVLEKVKNGIVTVNAFPALPIENFGIKQEQNEALSILIEQFKINKIHKSIETTDFLHLMQTIDSQEFFELINELKSQDKTCDSWCKEIFLKHLKLENFSSNFIEYVTEALLELNSDQNLVCRCDFPLPKAHESKIKHYEIGCHLLGKTESVNLLRVAPYLYKSILEGNPHLGDNLPLLIQFSDLNILKMFSSKMTYDLWDEAVKLLIKLKSNQCLNCGSEIDSSSSLNWTQFGVLMVESIKPTNAIKLLKRYSKHLPKGELDNFFYQYCILNSVIKINSQLSKSLENESGKQELDFCVSRFMRRKYLSSNDYEEASSQRFMKLEDCDLCQLPLTMQILNYEPQKLPCGHNYHQVCFLYNQSQCSVCKAVL